MLQNWNLTKRTTLASQVATEESKERENGHVKTLISRTINQDMKTGSSAVISRKRRVEIIRI